MSGAEEDRKRAQRAEQVALVPVPADPGGRRSGADRAAARPDGPRDRGKRASGAVRRAGHGVAGDGRPVDPGLAVRRVRGAGAAGPAGHAADRSGGAGAGRRAEAGEPGADRGAGGADPAEVVRLVAVGADAAAALRPAGAEHPPGRAGPGGVRPVRGAGAERHLDRGRAARPAGRGPQGLLVRFPGRSFPGGDGRPLGLLRGQRAAGRRAAPGAGRPRRPVPGLRR